MSIQVTISKSDKDKVVIVTAKQNGKQLMRSPMTVKQMNKPQIEKQVRKDLGVYDSYIYGGMSVIFDF